ncbi:hypothetical protein FRB93_005191 [Tulasnella sp. JGI-2019a]|nr:hypothetical protein FRB93_005191 [Tulasnella sp. JGI-2019a]
MSSKNNGGGRRSDKSGSRRPDGDRHFEPGWKGAPPSTTSFYMSGTQPRTTTTTQPAATTTAATPTTIKKASPVTGPAGPAPSSAPPAAPTNQILRTPTGSNIPRPSANVNGSGQPQQRPATNGTHTTSSKITKKKVEPPPPDPTVLYENVKNRIAALEEAAVQGEEEERKTAEEARSSIKGHSDSVIQSKYIELFQEMKRMERDHTKEKQKLVKEKDASKSQLTKATTSKTKLENLARELQKDNKKLREDTRRLAGSVDDAQDEISSMKEEMERRFERAKKRERKIADAPDVMVKVTCKYRAELFFKISRKTKLSRLFNVWTERMDVAEENARTGGETRLDKLFSVNSTVTTPNDKKIPPGTKGGAPSKTNNGMQFMFTHLGRIVEPDQTPDDLGMESGDEILAVEMMDLTVPNETEDLINPSQREKIRKSWTDKPAEAKAAMEEIFDGVVRERLKDVLRQYERRERHFECVIRSKELEVLVSRARAEEQKQVAEGERQIASVAETQNQQLRQQMEDMQNSQSKLMDKLIACCKEPTGERTQRLFSFLREELEKRGTKLPPEDDGLLGTGDNSDAEPSHSPSPIDEKRENHLNEEDSEVGNAPTADIISPTTISV